MVHSLMFPCFIAMIVMLVSSDFCSSIETHFSSPLICPYLVEETSVKDPSLVEMTRSILTDSHLPDYVFGSFLDNIRTFQYDKAKDLVVSRQQMGHFCLISIIVLLY